MEATLGERFWHFHGGLRLRHWKRMSLASDPVFAGTPPRVRIPLNQHQGEPARAVVEVGQEVARGELIADIPRRVIGARVHASVSGVVRFIGRHEIIDRSGLPAECIEIETRAGGREVSMEPIQDWESCDRAKLVERIWAAGIAGLGGSVFPTHVKMDPPADSPVELLIVNGAECEPYIAADETLMRHRPEEVVRGSLLAARAIGAGKTVIAIEDQMGAVEHILRQTERELGAEDLQIVKVPTIYPEGGEKQLIRVLTGKEVPSGGLPLDLGMATANVGTVVAAWHAVTRGRPLISRIVTVTGHGINSPGNFEVLIGTPVSFLVEQADGYTEDVRRLVMGGPMMGVALPHDDLPVMKATNCVLGLAEDEVRGDAPELPCIRCMACERVCPARLLPQQLLWHIQAEDYPQVERHGLFDCIECGCCAYACPSQIPLVDYYRFAKSEIRARAVERARAAHARHRFEVRNQRLEEEQAAKDARLEEKRAALADTDGKQDAIRAAIERARKRKASEEEPDDAV